MRLLLLTTPHTYRAEAFRAAARNWASVVTAIDLPDALGKPREAELTVDFRDPERAVQHIVAYAQGHPLAAILSVDDSASLIALRPARPCACPTIRRSRRCGDSTSS